MSTAWFQMVERLMTIYITDIVKDIVIEIQIQIQLQTHPVKHFTVHKSHLNKRKVGWKKSPLSHFIHRHFILSKLL